VPISTIPHIFYRPDALPATQPTTSKHRRQLAHLDKGEDSRVLLNGVTRTVCVPYRNWRKSDSESIIGRTITRTAKYKAIVDHTSPPITPFSVDPICSEHVTMHCQRGRKPPTLRLTLWISSHCRRRADPRPYATSTEKLVKIALVVPEICSRTDRQTDRHTHTHTDGLITILRHRSRSYSH